MAENYQDCLDIEAEHSLWRRVMPNQWVVDENRGGILRPSSAAFENCIDGDPMSSFWAERHKECGLDESHILRNHDGFSIASFKARAARDLHQIIHLDPITGQENPLDNQPAHVLVVGHKPKKSVSKKLALASIWIVKPATKT
ncbi:MAG: hypothetical protein WC028_03040 [Candidatus Obscuribacterales bacterium]